MLPRDALLEGCRQPQQLAALIDLAEQALRTWEPVWSGFVAAELRELALERLGALTELHLDAGGGWPQAERQRLSVSVRNVLNTPYINMQRFATGPTAMTRHEIVGRSWTFALKGNY